MRFNIFQQLFCVKCFVNKSLVYHMILILSQMFDTTIYKLLFLIFETLIIGRYHMLLSETFILYLPMWRTCLHIHFIPNLQRRVHDKKKKKKKTSKNGRNVINMLHLKFIINLSRIVVWSLTWISVLFSVVAPTLFWGGQGGQEKMKGGKCKNYVFAILCWNCQI